MQRRRAVAVAGAAVVSAFAATVGLGANLGLFGLVQPASAGNSAHTPSATLAAAHAPTTTTGGSHPMPDD
jgi:hypothetical protein